MVAAILLILAAVFYRVVTAKVGGSVEWLPNFAPVAAIALCAGMFFPKRIALVLPAAILLFSDLILNAHYGVGLLSGEMIIRYAAFLLIGIFGMQLGSRISATKTLGATVGGSLFFYITTNTVAWLSMAAYSKTFAGWVQALTIGTTGHMPTWMFFRNSLISDLVFTALFLVCLRFAASKQQETATVGHLASSASKA